MYKSEFCQRIKDHCRDGHSVLSFINVLDAEYDISITYKTLIKWASEKEEFKLALDIAQSAEMFYWEEKAANAMKGGDSQALQLAKFMLDQKAGLYERIYKKTFTSSTAGDMGRKVITMDSSNPDRDALAELLEGN